MNKNMSLVKVLLIKLWMDNSKNCNTGTFEKFENFCFPSYKGNYLN